MHLRVASLAPAGQFTSWQSVLFHSHRERAMLCIAGDADCCGLLFPNQSQLPLHSFHPPFDNPTPHLLHYRKRLRRRSHAQKVI